MRRPSQFLVILPLLLLVVIGAIASHHSLSKADDMATDATSTVSIINDSFKPDSLTVKAGTKVSWTNKDDDPHTVTSERPLFDSKGLALGDSFSFVFSKPGTYKYYCKVHPFMKAVVVVTEAH